MFFSSLIFGKSIEIYSFDKIAKISDKNTFSFSKSIRFWKFFYCEKDNDLVKLFDQVNCSELVKWHEGDRVLLLVISIDCVKSLDFVKFWIYQYLKCT